KRPNQLRRHHVPPNIEMQKRPLRLRPPVNICGDFDLAHGVGFGAGFHLGGGLSRNWGFGKSGHDGVSCYAEPIIIRRRERQSSCCDRVGSCPNLESATETRRRGEGRFLSKSARF